MKRGAFYIASHMSELGEEFLSYHRDEDYKIVRLRDDLLSATRYAFMMRRQGKMLDELRGLRPRARRRRRPIRSAAAAAGSGTSAAIRQGHAEPRGRGHQSLYGANGQMTADFSCHFRCRILNIY